MVDRPMLQCLIVAYCPAELLPGLQIIDCHVVHDLHYSDRFGAKRVMWGSNYPATHDRSLKEQLAMAREELSFLPSEDQRWLFGETALTLWPMLR